MKRNWKSFAVPLLITWAVGGLAAFLTSGAMEAYDALNQPSFAPPDWIFPVAWSILYTLMGIAAGLIVRSDSHEKDTALFSYGAQLFVNFWWPIFFFCWGLRLLALFWLVLLLVLAVVTLFEFRSVNKTAGWLLAPYVVWLLFALALNLAVYLLNR